MAGQCDYYLKIDNIPQGESPDSEYNGSAGWNQIDSWSFGAHQEGTADYGGGLGAGRVKMQTFNFVMKVNKASPALFLACANGQHFPKATVVARKSGTTPQTFLKWTFTDCLVASFQTGGSGGSDISPTDSVSLNFAKLEQEYKPQKDDGSLDGAIKCGWDCKKNQKM